MALRCKPGDLAVLVSGSKAGYIVEVIERASGDAQIWETWYGPCWLVRTQRPVRGERLDGTLDEPCRMQICADKQLRPIRPDAEPEAIERTRDLEVTA